MYLRPHLRVLICFRLAASKEESIETVRQDSNALLKKRRRWKKTGEGKEKASNKDKQAEVREGRNG